MTRVNISNFFVLGFRLAIFPAIVFLPISFLLLLIWLSWAQSILAAVMLSLIVFAITYFFALRIMKQRVTMLSTAFENIAKKQFEEQLEFRFKKQDEVDYLLLQSAKTSLMVEKEIQRLNKIENYRKEFIGDISHELKTPIFAVQGFVETLLNGALEDPEVNRVFLKKAMKNIKRLTYLTQDLMEISKLETGELKSVIQTIPLNTVIREVIESLNYKASDEQIDLKFEEHKKDLYVLADRNQIRQVLINLVENAIKYNHKQGMVTIHVNKDKTDESKIRVTVSDTGIGIHQPDIERITERFYRVDKSRSREKGGTGLGLAIVKHILEAHGTKLIIDSVPNKGSTFSFDLMNADSVSA